MLILSFLFKLFILYVILKFAAHIFIFFLQLFLHSRLRDTDNQRPTKTERSTKRKDFLKDGKVSDAEFKDIK